MVGKLHARHTYYINISVTERIPKLVYINEICYLDQLGSVS